MRVDQLEATIRMDIEKNKNKCNKRPVVSLLTFPATVVSDEPTVAKTSRDDLDSLNDGSTELAVLKLQ